MARKPVVFRFGADTKGLSRGVRGARAQLRSLDDSAQRTAAAFRGMAGVAGAAVGALATSKLVSVTREFERLHAQLITATGSSKNASIAFGALQQFAAQTPYDLQQVTEGFTKLVNLGLTPSAAALRSYGDTASAMGKDLNQLIEAVADAATGEFERLKEFGIRASSQGDQVALTFRGVTTTVKKNAAEIEQYLIQLGQNNFAGAMAERMDTLDGALSNLGDSWDLLFNTISQQGSGALIEQGVRLAIAAIEELTAMIQSGQLAAQIDALASKFTGWGYDSAGAVREFDTEIRALGYSLEETGKFLADAFVDFPENVRALIQIAAVEVGAFVDNMIGAGELIADALNPFDDVDMESAYANYMAKHKAQEEARLSSIDMILAERDAALQSFDDQSAAADEMRAKFEANRAAMAAEGGDPLAGFGIAPPTANDDPADADFEKRLEKLLGRYETEQQLEFEHQQALADIKRGFAEGEIASQQEFDAIMLQAEKDYGDKLKSLRKKTLTDLQRFNQASFQQQAKTVFAELANITNGVARENRAMFEINKVAGIANAIISAHEGISKTLASYPYPLNIGMAAAHAAAAFAQVNAIKGAQFNSGGAAPSLAGGTAAPPVTPVGGQAVGGGEGSTGVTFVRGIDPSHMYSGEQLVEILNEAQRNGHRLALGRAD